MTAVNTKLRFSPVEVRERKDFIQDLELDVPDHWGVLVVMITPRGAVSIGGVNLIPEAAVPLLELVLKEARESGGEFGRSLQ